MHDPEGRGDLIHARTVGVRIYESGEDILTVEGTLQDDRFVRSYVHERDLYIDPGSRIHDFIIRMTLRASDAVILSAEAEMPVVPVPECEETIARVKELAGLSLMSGFQKGVREIMGGSKGCLHLIELLIAMSGAAMQGIWTYYYRVRAGNRIRSLDIDHRIVRDSCKVWRADGAYYVKLEKLQGKTPAE